MRGPLRVFKLNVPRRLFGVPFSRAERQAVSQNYLDRRIRLLRSVDMPRDEPAIQSQARREMTDHLDAYLNEIASRSQTLLTVIALLIAAFLVVSKPGSPVQDLCVLWGLGSCTLFANIWLFFGPAVNYSSDELVYIQTVRLAHRRSVVFNGNIVGSVAMSLLSLAFYSVDLPILQPFISAAVRLVGPFCS